MSGTYASKTEVSPSKSRDEIERTLSKYGAQQFAYGWNGTHALIGFVIHDRQVRFVLPLPDREDREFTVTSNGYTKRAATAAQSLYDQAVRQRWRSLLLIVKAKLQAVESGIVTFEDEFAMHMVLPDGRQVREVVNPAIAEAYESGRMPSLLAIESS